MIRWCALTALLALVALPVAPVSDMRPDLRELLTGTFRFPPADVADLEKGKVVTRGLPGTSAGEVAAVGAIRVRASRDTFVDRYRDIARFKRGPDVVQIGRFSDPPVLDDLQALTVLKQDVDLRGCRVGNCDIRLPADIIARFQREVDWKARDADARAAQLFKIVLLDNVRAFVSGGPGRIVQYDDDRRPVRPVDDFLGLLAASPYVAQLAPGLVEHLKGAPASRIAGAEDLLYWSKEKFGFTPFITVTQATILPATPSGVVIASRDVYSSRYFDASLTLTLASDAVNVPNAFYLVYVNRSRANALKGALSGFRRSIVERRAKSSLEENLRLLRTRLEMN